MQEYLRESVEKIRELLGGELPAFALVLGSGFDGVTAALRERRSIAYEKLPGFPAPRIEGHAGRLILADLGGMPLVVCSGRAHYYEGRSMEEVTFPTRALAAAGVSRLVLTNAAGGINPRLKPGSFMLIADHINFTGVNPLRGLLNDSAELFVDVTDAYSAALRRYFRAAGRKKRIPLNEGVYLGVSGPSYETPAEIRAFRRLGADAVGMSTIPEVLMARRCGMEVAALSCITNHAAGLRRARLSHAEVLAVGHESASRAAELLAGFTRELHESGQRAARKAVEKKSPWTTVRDLKR